MCVLIDSTYFLDREIHTPPLYFISKQPDVYLLCTNPPTHSAKQWTGIDAVCDGVCGWEAVDGQLIFPVIVNCIN